MIYRILQHDAITGEDTELCYTVSREGAQNIIAELLREHPEQRFAVVVDEREEPTQ